MMDHPVGCGTYAFLCTQRQALIRDFEKPDSCFVAISPDKLELMQQREGWTVEYLSNCHKANAFVVRKSSNCEPECWVRWDYTGYRKAFANFLQLYYSEFHAVLNASVHVDHLEPQYRFPRGSNYFVRLHLVPKEINAAYGAGFERSFYRTEREKELHGVIHMSWVAFCKAKGARPPTKSAGPVAWDVWARQQAGEYSEHSRESAAWEYAGLLSVLRLGYTGFYSGEAKSLDIEQMLRDFESAQALKPSFPSLLGI